MREKKQERSERLPNRYFRIGEIVKLDGCMYKVVERRMSESFKDRFSMTCNGCDLRNKPCERLACSKPDRLDSKFVWFVKID